jgi:hypothetical protein
VPDGAESGDSPESQDYEDDWSRTRNQFGKLPRHVSYHDIICEPQCAVARIKLADNRRDSGKILRPRVKRARNRFLE